MQKIAWTSILKRTKTIITKVAEVFFTKDTATFFLFLCLASAFWFMHTIGTRRAMTVSFDLVYEGIPNDVLLTTDLPQHVTFSVKNEGQKLMNYYLNADVDTLVVDLSNSFDGSGQVIYDMQLLKSDIQRRLPESSQIEDLTPGLLTLNYLTLGHKVLPIRLSEDVPLAAQYVLADSISITPALVNVYAPQAVLDTMHFIAVKPFFVKPLSKTSVFKEPLMTLEYGHVEVSEVQINVPIELSTEKTLEIPIQSVNFPSTTVLRTFPAFVRVTFSIGVSRFNSVTANDFKAEVFYEDLENTKEHQVKVHLSTLHTDVLNMRYAPMEVEFLLEKE
ncbi:MAG: hypothetical protein PHI42_06845 [Paludibacteraceae bacterium]|nr:hypothetical protein [Paludibacteraceae bacterium]